MLAPRENSSRLWSVRGLVVCGAILYTALLAWHLSPQAGGSDTSGYLNHARLLAAGRVRTPTRALPGAPAKSLTTYAYMPLGFSPADPGDSSEMVPTYPPGLPLLLAGASAIAGWTIGPSLIVVAHALAGLALMYALARELNVSRGVAAIAVAALGLSPVYVFGAVQVLSDLPAMVWTAAAVWAALRSERQRGWAIAAGGALGFAVAMRPTDALAMVPVAIVLGRDGRRWLGLAAGGAPLAAAMLAFNAVAYGDPLRSGYGPIWNAFAGAVAPATLRHYAVWLPVVLTPAIVLGAGLPFVDGPTRRHKAVVLAWAGVFFGFYLFYPFTRQGWWWLRFVLPAFPAVILAASLVGERLVSRLHGAAKLTLAATLLGVTAWSGCWTIALPALAAGHHERLYAEACAWTRERVPAGAVMFAMEASGALHYYTDLTVVQWTFATPDDRATIERAAAAGGRPIFALLLPHEEAPFLEKTYPGDWREVGAVAGFRCWQRFSRPKQ